MGIDICYWYDNNLTFTTIQALQYQLERYLEARICIFHAKDDSDTWKFKNLRNLSYEELRDVTTHEKAEYRLEIVDFDGKITDLKNQNIDELVKNREISLYLCSNNDDIEIHIYHKTLEISGYGALSLPGRMSSFIRTIENPEEGFTDYYLKSFYRMNKIVKAFNTSKVLLIGDTQSVNWEYMDEDLDEGMSIPDALEKYKDGIKIITETDILQKKLQPAASEDELHNHVYLFDFEVLFPFLIPCPLREEPVENEQTRYVPAVSLEVSIEMEEHIPKTIKKEVIRIEKDTTDSTRYYAIKELYDNQNNLYSKQNAFEYYYKKIDSYMQKITEFDFNYLKNHFNYSGGKGKIYSISYRKCDFSISASLWCSDDKTRVPAELVDFVDNIIEFSEKPFVNVPHVGTVIE